MLTFALSTAVITIDTVGSDAKCRTVYRYCVIVDGKSHEAADLRSGVGQSPTEREMLGTLLAFLGAAGESYPNGENADLFPPWLSEWASLNQEEIDMEREEIENPQT